MADGCIEQALTALNQAWSHHGSMTVSIPQVSEAFGKLQTEFRQLGGELQRAIQRITDQDQTITRLHVDLSTIKSTLSSTTKTLSSLLEGSNTIVRQDDLVKALHNVADADSLNLLKEVVARVQTRMSGMADETTIRILTDMSESNKSSLESLSNRVSEEARSTRTQTSAIEHELAETGKKFGASLTRIAGELQRTNEVADRRHSAIELDWTSRLEALRREADESLASSVTELVEHIKVQAAAVEELQRDRANRSKDAPSKDELVQMKVEMDAVKRDIERAQFKIHEAYSQCIAIAKHTGQQGSSASGTLLLANSSILPSKSSSFEATSSTHRSDMPSSVEVQLELLKRDVNKIFTESMPHTNNAIAAQREQLDAVVDMNFRAQQHLESLIQCLLGSNETSDELLSALTVRDNGRIKLILRRCLGSISDVPTSNPARAAPTPQVFERTPIQLGIDVADFVDKVTKEASVQVMRVTPNGVGAMCGLLAKDRILQVGEVYVTTVQSFVLALRKVDAARSRRSASGTDSTLEIHIRRGQEVKVLYVSIS